MRMIDLNRMVHQHPISVTVTVRNTAYLMQYLVADIRFETLGGFFFSLQPKTNQKQADTISLTRAIAYEKKWNMGEIWGNMGTVLIFHKRNKMKYKNRPHISFYLLLIHFFS